MSAQPPPTQAPGLDLGDIYYTLFRHKWKIIVCTCLGLAAALAFYRLRPPSYQSEAKLFIRYVASEKQLGAGTLGPDSVSKSPDMRGETIMNSEAEIIGSLDLATKVAEAIGAEKILARAGGGKEVTEAAAFIKLNLTVEAPKFSSVIHLVFTHPDPEIVQPILREIIAQYLKLHLEIHRAVGIRGEFLTQETDQLRSRLAQTEEELRKTRNKAGVISLEDTKKILSEQIAATRQLIFGAQADLAERTSSLQELAKREPKPAPPPAETVNREPEKSVSSQVLEEYQAANARISFLQKKEQELLLQYTAENSRVKEVRSQITEAEGLRQKMEEQYPKLTRIPGVASSTPAAVAEKRIDFQTAAAGITALQAKIKVLTTQLDQLREEAAKVDELEGTYLELRRRKDLEESNYRYYSASLEQARTNEALSNGKVSNISQIQTPSPPTVELKKTQKTVAGIAVGGLALGLGWAFLIELLLDRSIKRPADVERLLRLPLFLSIPDISRRSYRRQLGRAKDLLSVTTPSAVGQRARARSENTSASGLGANDAPPLYSPPASTGSETFPFNGSTPMTVVTTEPDGALQPFHETLRDRLVGYFESINLTHKPKLVAVTSLGGKAGVTTISAGLARSLSETQESNVLLVDMTVGHGSAQQFNQGKLVSNLDELLEARTQPHGVEHLYVVAENRTSDRLSRNLPRRFTKLVPKLKASDFDYIIFDMPPVSQISITPRLAGFMDMVLLVIESEKTDRDVVQRATALLSESRANIGTVLNKTRNYVPAALHQEFLNST